MKKKASKILLFSLMTSLILIMSLVFTGCGSSEPSNLEEYINSNEKLIQEINENSTEGMTIIIKDNALTYKYAYDREFNDATAEYMKNEFEKAASTMDPTFESVKNTLIEETGFKDITVEIIYTDNAGTVLYEKTY